MDSLDRTSDEVSGVRDGKNLIFIVSQPRSGSTLLQHLLASHPRAATGPESWLLLPLLGTLDPRGTEAPYRADWAAQAIREFLANSSLDDQVFYDAVREAALFIYDKALPPGATHFIDKTPRYYFVLPEIRRSFPNATIVILIRNPLEVFASLLKENLAGRWSKIFTTKRQHDIFTAPKLIADFLDRAGNNAVVVQYEDLVSNPSPVLRKICDIAGLTYDPSMVDYGDKVDLRQTSFRDTHGIYEHTKPVEDYVGQWRERLKQSGARSAALYYLKLLGPGTLDRLGYHGEDIITELSQENDGCRAYLWRCLLAPPDDIGSVRAHLLEIACAVETMGIYRSVERALSSKLPRGQI